MSHDRSDPEASEALGRYATRAVQSAARELDIDPLELARRLDDAEIARLIHLLNAAYRHVSHAGLRHRIEDLLLEVTGGRMPGEEAESELDWALKVARRRSDRNRSDVDEPEEGGPDAEG